MQTDKFDFSNFALHPVGQIVRQNQLRQPGVLPDEEIRRLAIEEDMITPFADYGECTKEQISFGLSHFGYDTRLGTEFTIYTRGIIDPKKLYTSTSTATFAENNRYILPSHSFTLCHSLEYYKIPNDVLAIVLGKSTYARCGLVVNATPLEPGWEGQITLELSNTAELAIPVYPHEGIAQVLFFRGTRPERTYAEKKGKYQGQTGVTLPRLQ